MCIVSFITVFPWHMQTMSSNHQNGGISFFWSWSYWSTFLLTWYASCNSFMVLCLRHFHIPLCTSNMFYVLERQATFTWHRQFLLVNSPKFFKIVSLSRENCFALSLLVNQTFLQDPGFESVDCVLCYVSDICMRVYMYYVIGLIKLKLLFNLNVYSFHNIKTLDYVKFSDLKDMYTFKIFLTTEQTLTYSGNSNELHMIWLSCKL